MPVLCDVCKREVPAGVRYCPHCGLEIVSERERASHPVPMETDVFDWEAEPGESKPYDVSRKQPPPLEPERMAELMQLASERLNAGQVLEASALLKNIPQKAISDPSMRATLDHLRNAIDARKDAIRKRCEKLAKGGDSDQLVAFLAGQAGNEMEPEEICQVALAAARKLLNARRPDGAADLLHLGPFRIVREEKLVEAHRALELEAHRARMRQHAFKSFVLLGSVISVAVIGLPILALVLWRGGSGLVFWILVPVLLIVAVAIAMRRDLQAWLKERLKHHARPRPSRANQKLERIIRQRRK
jgi:hypothetical protein